MSFKKPVHNRKVYYNSAGKLISNLTTNHQSLSAIMNDLVNAHKSNPITQEGTWTRRQARLVITE